MKQLKYLTIPLAVIVNTLAVRFIFNHTAFIDYSGGAMSLPIFIFLVMVTIVAGTFLAIFAVKSFADVFEKAKRKSVSVAVTATVLAVVVGVESVAFVYEYLLLFMLAVIFSFAALYAFLGALYTVVVPWLKSNEKIGKILSVSVGAALFLFSPLVFVSYINLTNQTSKLYVMGMYSETIAVSALLFIFGVTVLIGTFSKNRRLSWVRPAAAMLLVVLVFFSALVVGFTGVRSHSANPIKNAAIDVGMVRLGLTESDYVCAYKWWNGERIYLLKTGRTDSDAELSELLENTKIGKGSPRTVNGVKYKYIGLDYFGGYYIFTVIPA